MSLNKKLLRSLLLGATLSVGMTSVTAIHNMAFAQAVSGSVTGLVTDPANAVITKASIVATNVATGVVTTATTNGIGEYRLVNLAPGKYDIAISAQGFTKAASEIKGINLPDVLRGEWCNSSRHETYWFPGLLA